MSFLIKKLPKQILAILLSFIIMIVFFELFLLSIYKITNLNYVENIYEKKKRYNFYDPFLDLKKKKYELQNIEKKKIAIFGGSTANGFGVNISFYQILKKILEKEAIVHSYARNEAAFVQDQSLAWKSYLIFIINKIII